MSAPRRDYRRIELVVLGAWHASRGSPPPSSKEDVKGRAACSEAVAFRVWTLQQAASLRLVALWLEGALTLRQVERIALGFPFDEGAQLEEAREASPLARARLRGDGSGESGDG